MNNLINKLKLLGVKYFEHVYYWMGIPDLKHDEKYQKKYLNPFLDKDKSKNRKK